MFKYRLRYRYLPFVLVVLFVVAVENRGYAPNNVFAAVDFGYICNPVASNCWFTSYCGGGGKLRTETHLVRSCVYTGNYSQYCIHTAWSCYDVYSCPTEEYLGTSYTEGVCVNP